MSTRSALCPLSASSPSNLACYPPLPSASHNPCRRLCWPYIAACWSHDPHHALETCSDSRVRPLPADCTPCGLRDSRSGGWCQPAMWYVVRGVLVRECDGSLTSFLRFVPPLAVLCASLCCELCLLRVSLCHLLLLEADQPGQVHCDTRCHLLPVPRQRHSLGSSNWSTVNTARRMGRAWRMQCDGVMR